MPLPTTINDLFTSAASNSPSGGESPILTDDYMRLFAAFIAQLRDGQGFLTAVRSNSLGSVSVPAFSFVGDTDTGAWSPAADTYAVSTGGAERMRIAAAGNVTIATPSSGTALSINSLSSNYGIVCTDGTINTYIGLASSGASYNGVLTNHAYILRTNNTDRITVAAAGNVTIAAPSSGTALTVSGGLRVDAAVTTAAPTGGAADAPPAAPVGYVTSNIGGTDRKIAFYA